jgi:peptidoglycan-N-acetylglucosamine deacetylase
VRVPVSYIFQIGRQSNIVENDDRSFLWPIRFLFLKMISKRYLLSLLFILLYQASIGQQKQVAITLDDAPFTTWSERTSLRTIEEANSSILRTVSRYNVPVCIFINESPLIKEGETDARINVLKQWLSSPLVTAGNHSYSHPNYANMELAAFQDEIIKGEVITKKLLEGTGRSLQYFRFPFNALGRDSITKTTMQTFLKDKGYINTPFTIESSDYLFNTLYQQALNKNDKTRAKVIADAYISYTISVFEYFETLSQQQYQRQVPQIFLGHVNALHADCIAILIEQLKRKGYTFIDLTTALKDDVYKQHDYYAGPYGFSWFYRWERDTQKRKKLLQSQPEPPDEIYQQYLKAIRTVPAN